MPETPLKMGMSCLICYAEKTTRRDANGTLAIWDKGSKQ
jgi:hypothetical protein